MIVGTLRCRVGLGGLVDPGFPAAVCFPLVGRFIWLITRVSTVAPQPGTVGGFVPRQERGPGMVGARQGLGRGWRQERGQRWQRG